MTDAGLNRGAEAGTGGGLSLKQKKVKQGAGASGLRFFVLKGSHQ